MKLFSLFAGLALCAGATAADGQSVDMTGAWNMRFPIVIKSPGGRPAKGVPQCVFQQTGNELSGVCKMADRGEGAVTGTIAGQHVEWQWNFKFYPYARAHFTPAASDQFAVTTFKADLDAGTLLRGCYQSQFQQGWNRVFTAEKSPA
jgi:hypothetical protein